MHDISLTLVHYHETNNVLIFTFPVQRMVCTNSSFIFIHERKNQSHILIILHHARVHRLACLTAPQILTAWAVEQAGGAKAFVRRMSVPSVLLFFSDQVRNLDEP